MYCDFLFRKGDEVICPSCKRNVFVPKDVPSFRAKELVMCEGCRAYVKYGKLVKENNKYEN